MPESDYKKAYERQKLAREKAESLLEDRSRELYEANVSLRAAYDLLQSQQENLVQQEKMAALGMLSAGMAHEINNPIGFVDSNLQILKTYSEKLAEIINTYEDLKNYCKDNNFNDDHLKQLISDLDQLIEKNDLAFIRTDGTEIIEESLEGTRRIARIIFQLRNYARSDESPMGFMDLNKNIESVLKVVKKQLREKFELKKEFGKLQPVYGSGTQLSQVFLNMIVNAAQALDKPGVITINTSQKADMAEVTITDNGKGMDSNQVKNIFDPFFTTKGVGSGTGLGLSIVQGIIKKHRGTIEVNSEPGKGTSFTITLPLYPKEDS